MIFSSIIVKCQCSVDLTTVCLDLAYGFKLFPKIKAAFNVAPGFVPGLCNYAGTTSPKFLFPGGFCKVVTVGSQK